jgi:hypothetical protein
MIFFQQSKEKSHRADFNCDNNGEHEESIKLGEGTLPLCFSSFQLLKENLQNITSQQYHTNAIGHKEHYESTQDNSVPLCFSSFNILKKSFKIVNEAEKFKLEQSHMNQDLEIINQQQSITIFHDPIDDYI